MRLLIVGSGRMGIRHLVGALDSIMINSIDMFDINQTALDNAKKQIEGNVRNNIVNYIKDDSICKLDNHCDIAIVSSTANKREEILEKVISLGAKHVLVEKPLGQSLDEVMNLFNFCIGFFIFCCLNRSFFISFHS
jgi:predicted dehydrogenase